MDILVTGASGLIGAHAARALAGRGHRVTSVHRALPATGRAKGAIAADLLSAGAFDTLARSRPHAIVHAAAMLPGSFGSDEDLEAARANTAIDALVFRLARSCACPVVFTSSISVYGSSPSPWREDIEPSPEGAYAAAKRASEAMFAASGVRCVSLRISAPYGPGKQIRNVLRIFLERAMDNQDVAYFGEGAREQDFIYVSDIAEAVVKAVESTTASGAVNIGSGQPVSMRELAQIVVRNVEGSTSRVVASGQPDPQEKLRTRIDISRARSLLGWRPQVGLEEGVRRWCASLRGEACASE